MGSEIKASAIAAMLGSFAGDATVKAGVRVVMEQDCAFSPQRRGYR